MSAAFAKCLPKNKVVKLADSMLYPRYPYDSFKRVIHRSLMLIYHEFRKGGECHEF